MLVPIQLSVQQPIARALLPDLADTSLHLAVLNWQTAQDNLGTDYSAAGDDMTPVGAPTSERVGADFDGAADYLRRVEADWRSADEQGTISAWIKRSVIGANHVIFGSCDEGSTANVWYLYARATNRLALYSQPGGAVVSQLQGSTTLSAGQWYHIAMTSDGSTTRMYVNGVEETLSVVAGGNVGSWLHEILNRDSITIGAAVSNAAAFSYFNGEIRNVDYYSEAKSADWVKHDFQRGVPDDTLLLHVLNGDVDLSRYERTLIRYGGVVVGN